MRASVRILRGIHLHIVVLLLVLSEWRTGVPSKAATQKVSIVEQNKQAIIRSKCTSARDFRNFQKNNPIRRRQPQPDSGRRGLNVDRGNTYGQPSAKSEANMSDIISAG